MPHQPGVIGLLLKHLTRSTGGPCVSRIARLFIVKDKRRVAAALKQLAATPGLSRVIVSHHETIVDEPSAVLLRIAASLA